MSKKRTIDYPNLPSMQFFIKYTQSDPTELRHHLDLHTHPYYEIYINLTGDVSFIVNDQLYPIHRGNVLLSCPNEFHHCIYHSNKMHQHFCIFVSGINNMFISDLFHTAEKEKEAGRLLFLSEPSLHQLTDFLFTMIDHPCSDIENYLYLFQLLHLFQNADHQPIIPESYPDVFMVIDYIHENYDEKISFAELAKKANVSLNTLERHFSEKLRMSPSAYLKQIRMSAAAQMLHGGNSVTETCMKCGYSNCSAFIAYFTKTFGMTPLQYQKKKLDMQKKTW